MSPVLSVLMPVRQWRETTNIAVKSLLDQTFDDFELLVIGVTDTNELLKKLPKDQRIKGLTRPSPGIVSALNYGLETACGQFIARMDDDDMSHPERFATQLQYLKEHPDIALCGTRIRFVDQDGKTNNVGEGNQRYEKWLNGLTTPKAISDGCFIECPLPHPSWMAHRTVFEQLKGYRDFDGPEDYDFILRAWLEGIRMGKPDKILLNWRVHGSRLTVIDSRYRREAFTQCRARTIGNARSNLGLAEGRCVWICGTGRNARYWFDALIDNGCSVAGFVDLDGPKARQQKRHRPVITYEELWTKREEELVVTAITDPGARELLIAEFTSRGWMANEDYVIGG